MPSHLAQVAQQCDTEKLARLLDAGADIESRHKGTGRTALLSAVIAGHREAVELLLARGARLDVACTAMGCTALAWACLQGNTDLAALLIERGAPLDSLQTLYRRTPLMSAAQSGHGAIVALLLAAGADARLLDFEQHNAWSLADSRGHVGVQRLLAQAGAAAPPPAVEPLAPAWPVLPEGAPATVDPVVVVHAYVQAMHAWETDAKARLDANLLDIRDALTGATDLRERFCTSRKRTFVIVSVGFPPAYPAGVEWVSLKSTSASRAQVVVRAPKRTQPFRNEFLFVVVRKGGEWRIDNVSVRQWGTKGWRRFFL